MVSGIKSPIPNAMLQCKRLTSLENMLMVRSFHRWMINHSQ